MSDCFEVHQIRWKSILLALGSFGAVVAGLKMIGAFGDSSSQFDIALGLICITLSGYVAFLWSYRSLRPPVILRIDGSGLTDAEVSMEVIPWNKIRRAKCQTLKMRVGSWPFRRTILNHFLVFDVDPEFEFERQPPSWKRFRRLHLRGLGGYSNSIPFVGLAEKKDEIVDGFNRFAPARLQITSGA